MSFIYVIFFVYDQVELAHSVGASSSEAGIASSWVQIYDGEDLCHSIITSVPKLDVKLEEVRTSSKYL